MWTALHHSFCKSGMCHTLQNYRYVATILWPANTTHSVCVLDRWEFKLQHVPACISVRDSCRVVVTLAFIFVALIFMFLSLIFLLYWRRFIVNILHVPSITLGVYSDVNFVPWKMVRWSRQTVQRRKEKVHTVLLVVILCIILVQVYFASVWLIIYLRSSVIPEKSSKVTAIFFWQKYNVMTNNTVWAHILCALWIPGLSFDDDILRNEIDVSKHQNTEPATCMLCLEEGSIVYNIYINAWWYYFHRIYAKAKFASPNYRC